MIPYPTVIEGTRIVLKMLSPTPTNAQMVCDLVKKNTMYLYPFLKEVVTDGKDVLNALHHLRRADNLCREDDTALYYIFHQGKMVGAIEALMYPHERELRFWLDHDAKGKGLMREAVLLMEKMLFERNQDRIILGILDSNTPSLKLAKRLGYTEDWEGYFEITYDKFHMLRKNNSRKSLTNLYDRTNGR
ncbi:MAG: GNAT family N-acetyltransferase [Alphaproteobacteria bacterium]|nr:GNAT family N-acetyltransferase [Alphaproteobacteria bacterium]